MEVPRESNERGRTATEEEGRSQWSWHGYYHDRPCCPGNLDPACFSIEMTFTPNSLSCVIKGKFLICKSTQKVEVRDCGEIKMISDCNFFPTVKGSPHDKFCIHHSKLSSRHVFTGFLESKSEPLCQYSMKVIEILQTSWHSRQNTYVAM